MATKPTLHIPASGNRWYCGPFAFATLTGCNFKSTRTRLNDMANRPLNSGIRGYKTNDLVSALRTMGLRVSEDFISWNEEPLFKDWAKDHPDGTYLLELTMHFVIVSDGWFIDNHTKGKVAVDFAPWKRKRVKRVFRIT